METVLTRKPRQQTVLAGLGLTSEQRSAEIVAGLRAVTFPSPEAEVLSSPAGRAVARFLSLVSGSDAIKNATGGRHLCMTHLVEDILSEKGHPKRIVELGAGFSGRGLALANAFPNSQVIEIDLPAVVEAKQARLHQMQNGRIPKNLSWVCANLSKVPMTQLLEPGSVDLLICEGMLPYFTPQAIAGLAAAMYSTLSWEGVYIGDVVNSLGWQTVENTSRLGTWIFHRQAGKFKGKFAGAGEPRKLFEQAGFARVAAHPLQALSQDYLPSIPVANVSFILAAYKSG